MQFVLKYVIAMLLVVSTGSSYAQIPDYNKPYAPIYTDKPVYSWTDKVRITIVAPSWNENTHGIDSIGDDSDHAVKISTASHKLEPYRLTETAANSGVFSGEVTLTGFSHDVDGDGHPDVTPRTMGNGPTDGLLETKRDDGITISFEFADGVVLTKSAKVSWNVGELSFSQQSYLGTEQVTITVTDPDMNLNPEVPDSIILDVSSDSDSAGVSVTATETDDYSGVFEASITLSSNNDSSGNRLYAVSDDTLTAKYSDRTLPSPYGVSDQLDLTATSSVGSSMPSTLRISLDEIYFADSSGKKISQITSGQQMQIVDRVQNNQGHSQKFTYIIQISDENDAVVSLFWISAELGAAQSLELSQSWIPAHPGNYKIESFVWKSLENATPLAQNSAKSVSVE